MLDYHMYIKGDDGMEIMRALDPTPKDSFM
jgi:hypothetical protein